MTKTILEQFREKFDQDTDENYKVAGWLRMKVGAMNVKIATPQDIEHFLTTIKEQMIEAVGEDKSYRCQDCVGHYECGCQEKSLIESQAKAEIRQAIIKKFGK